MNDVHHVKIASMGDLTSHGAPMTLAIGNIMCVAMLSESEVIYLSARLSAMTEKIREQRLATAQPGE